MFNKLIERVTTGVMKKITIAQWITGFITIVFIRLFLELFSSTPDSSIIVNSIRNIHFILFFLSITLLLTFVVSIITKQKGNAVITLALYGLPIIFLAPVIDLSTSALSGHQMGYLFDTHLRLFFDFLTFFGPLNSSGITIGIRIEVFIILCVIGLYTWIKRKSILPTLGSIFISYALIFIVCSLPGLLYTVSHLPPQESIARQELFNFINDSIAVSNISTNISTSPDAFLLGAETITSQLFYVLSFIAGLAWFWYAHREKMLAILSNARAERVLFYMSLLALGVLYAQTKFSIIFNWVDWLSLFIVAISWFSAWMFSVHTNDIADIEIDTISNSNRPLVQKIISVETMRDISYIWLVSSIIGSYIISHFVFFMNIVYLSAYYVYSSPPLRLKRIPIFSSFLISIACLSTVLAGFFLISPDKTLSAFPITYAIGIIILFTLGVNIRDIKDIEGDASLGIPTLPILFGAYGKKVVGLLLALSFLLTPIFFPLFVTHIVSIPFAILGYWLCVKNPYKERYIFMLFFTFCLMSILFYILTI